MTRRLIVSYLAVTLVVLIVLELPLAIFFQQRELDRLTVGVERDATVLATIYEDALERDLPLDPGPADDYHASTGARVVVVDPDGISLLDTELEPDRDFSTRPEIGPALAGGRASGTRFSETLNTELLYVAVPVASGGTVHGALRITFDTQEVNDRVWRFRIALIGVAVVILAMMAAVGTVLARSVSRPVRRLQTTAERFAVGDLTPADVDTRAPPEVAALGTAMNTMAARLDDLIERQRSFVADASHQLRTPLTALRLRLENLHSEATDPETADQLSSTIEETARLSTLVNDLLQLARAEQAPDVVTVDLVDVVGHRVDTWTATAELAEVRLELRVPDGRVHATVVAGGVEQALDNLIDNAIRASGADAVVRVEVLRGATMHSVSVADHGPGIGDDDKRHALTRFWRSDTSTPGTGLGLAIADTIVRASGGTLELADNDPTGLIATFTLPAVAPENGADRGSDSLQHRRPRLHADR